MANQLDPKLENLGRNKFHIKIIMVKIMMMLMIFVVIMRLRIMVKTFLYFPKILKVWNISCSSVSCLFIGELRLSNYNLIYKVILNQF